MEKKIKALIVIALIAGAGVAVGVTAGIIMSQQGAMDQILLLLAIRPPVTVPRMWTWVAGNDTIDQKGTYGTMDVPAAGNIPGSRSAGASWTGSDGNFWLFGGEGRDSAGSLGHLNDLWMFNLTSGWWTWVAGNDTINKKGTYGTMDVPDAGNFPGARRASASWTGSDGNFWLFGGDGRDSAGSSGRLNDLWMFNLTSKWWTWMAGNDTINQNGTYGTMGEPDAGNIPGSRYDSTSWTGSDGNLWLFGGDGRDSVGGVSNLNDLWMFNLTSGWWTWVAGNDTINQKGTYGTMGEPDAGNIPGTRSRSVSWTGSDGDLWLFGGYGKDSAGSNGYLNDLWTFNLTSKWWTWAAGNDTINQNGTYGPMGVPDAGNFPGGRISSVIWMSSGGYLWLFGGHGRDIAGGEGRLNDLWTFNLASGWWTWAAGNDTINQNGTYGTMDAPDAGNIPGARRASTSWTDPDGDLWLFGGYGIDSAGGEGVLNDLWKYG